MESPPLPSASPTACIISDLSLVQPESPSQPQSDSFAESQQCSADPNAFPGYHVSPNVNEEAATIATRKSKNQNQKSRLRKFVLDMDATTGEVTRGGDGGRSARGSASFDASSDDLFAADTQVDEERVTVAVTEAGDEEKMFQSDDCGNEGVVTCTRDRRSVVSPLVAMEIAGQDQNRYVAEDSDRKKEKKVEWSQKKKKRCDTDDSIRTCSEYSEHLSPDTVFETALASNDDDAVCVLGKNAVMRGEMQQFEESNIDRGSERETDRDDEVECTQLIEESEVDADEIRHCDDEEAFCYEARSVSYEKVRREKTSDEQKVDGSRSHSQENFAAGRTLHQNSGQQSDDDMVTSRERLQAMQQECLTLTVKSRQPEPYVSTAACGDVELTPKTLIRGDDEDECLPTQLSNVRTDSEPMIGPNSPSYHNMDNVDAPATREHIAGSDYHAKAIRSLQFSGSMPDSQEDEPDSRANLCSEGTLAATRFESLSGSDEPYVLQSSASPPCLPLSKSTPTSTPTLVDGITPEGVVASRAQLKGMSPSSSGMSAGTRKQDSLPQVDCSNQNTCTPVAKKRKRGFLSSPDNVSLTEYNCSNPLTPRPPARRRTRSTQSTPSSTPKVRTRTRVLSPVPSQRAYVSRSRTLFKYKFEFCLTGFVKSGEENLKELIEGHGGKIPERYQDVLYKGNLKAVVIATPVSWRKRKFMQAVACGIPVVHTDWIKDCIEEGGVIPFDGYQVPTGYSVTTRKFECLPPRHLEIFAGYTFGIASDVAHLCKLETKEKMNLIAFILKACGAKAVLENLSAKDNRGVDVVLCDEYTPTCRYYRKTKDVPVKGFQWVTECVILQRLLDPREPVFEPLHIGRGELFAASTEIGDSDNTTLKLYTGELVLADIASSTADHYLLFSVCEILSIYVTDRNDAGLQSKRKDCNKGRVMLRVGMLKREPYDPELSKTPVKVIDIASSQVKRRVVAISKEHYGQLKYKDESVFYVENGASPTSSPCRSASS